MSNAQSSWSKCWMVAGISLLSLALTAPAMSQDWARNDGSVPVVRDWSNKHLVYTTGYSKEQFEKMRKDPRAYATMLAHGIHGNWEAASPVQALAKASQITRPDLNALSPRHRAFERSRNHRFHPDLHPALKRDWAVPLGAGGVAAGAFPAKYQFDVNAEPSCTSDFVVFPVNATTGNTRANVVGTFSTTIAGVSGGTVAFTVTPTGGTAVTLTLTASTTVNTGTNFEVFTTASPANATTEATNLALAINRNLSATALGELAAVASTNTVTVYALTPGTGAVLSDTVAGEAALTFAAVTAGTNGNQANIVGFNQLYSGTTTPFCVGLTYPEFIFSYAAGVGPVPTSPTLSLNGQEIVFVENDPNLGAILHELTIASGATEYGSACAASNAGTALPTCATAPVIPGSTSGSAGSDYMLPLGLVGNLAPETPATHEADSYSSPFVDYSNQTAYVGDNNGYLYAVGNVFSGTPALTAGFPTQLNTSGIPAEAELSSPVVDVSGTGNIFVGDSYNNLYNVSAAGTNEATLVIGGSNDDTAGGVRADLIIDSTNAVGYAVIGCNGIGSDLNQFSFTSTSLASKENSGTLDSEGCSGPAPMYDPTPDNNYFTKGISSATEANNGELLVCYAQSGNMSLNQYGFTSGAMSTTAEYDNEFIAQGGAYECSPLTEFYGKDVSYAISAVAQSGTTVTVTTAANAFVTGQMAVIAGVTADTGDACTSAMAGAINGEQTITVVSPTEIQFTSTQTGTTAGTGCSLSAATAVGPTQDYLFFGINYTAPEAYTFTLPLTSATQAATATNTADATGGTSGMIVDNDSTDGEASSIYFGTEAASTSLCGTTAAYCAVKVTQGALQ